MKWVRLAAPLFVALATGPSVTSAEQVVLVREMRTRSDMPFGGVVRVVQRIEGARVREEVTMTMNSMPFDSLAPDESKRKKSADEPMQSTSIWFPEDRVWREWSAGHDVYNESTAEDVVRAMDSDQESGLEEFIGGPSESLVQEVEVAVDSTGTAATIAGIRARPYIFRGLVRLHELEHNVGDSVRVVREIWIAPTIAGTGDALSTLRNSPSRIAEKALTYFQLLALPVLKNTLKLMDNEVARLAGFVMRDELRVEPGSKSRVSAAPDSSMSLLMTHTEVLEVRSEPSRPDLFRVPANVHKLEPPPRPTIHRSGNGR